MPPLLNERERVEALRLARSQPESLPEFNRLVARLKAKVTEIALADGRVRERLATVRHRVLAVDYREEKAPNGDLVRLGDVAVYDYDRDALLIVTVDGQTSEVVRVREAVGAPPITDDERAEALDLVARHSESAGAFTRSGSEVVAFPTPSYAFDAEPKRYGHRGCTLYVASEHDAVAAVTVDLSAREIVPNERLPEVLHSRRAR
jgi:hypothetical protein